ncbi:uncharacterized protein LOC105830035 [Monomorium pharaonis]|uniref:uncharacterized protein LOC105830035 n=1 Tax=Monomorium pharaonis TaxID=307658 RepID=UPI00102E1110|nr:uncharacterized protein LOC105830035 [Monomorium pharaonis]
MDGKHCVIDPSLQSGSMFYNYKGDYSVALALVDAQLRFIYVNVGISGRVSNSGVWNTQENFPFVIIRAEGFPLSEKLLIPYPGPQCSEMISRRIFNYRLSRARPCSENAFGVMAARF